MNFLKRWWQRLCARHRARHVWVDHQPTAGWTAFYCQTCDRVRTIKPGSEARHYDREGQSYVAFTCEACSQETEVKRIAREYSQAIKEANRSRSD